jgi:uncharacterized membrane protein YoaK (UPF0700 family)
VIEWFGSDQARLLAGATTAELVLFGVATVVVGLSAQPVPAGSRDAAVILLALATGIQNAVVRRLAVPDLTTTVLTMTLTGIAADIRGGVRSTAFARRVLAVATMLGGAVAGAELVLHDGPTAALAVGTTLLAVITAAAWQTTRRPWGWRKAGKPAPAAGQGGTR